MPDIVYLIGEPGVGKSTVLADLATGAIPETRRTPFAHTAWWVNETDYVVELGARREAFSGTDALSMSVQPAVVAWLAETDCENVIAEGDRLGNLKFFGAVDALGWRLTVILLAAPAEAARRRAARAQELGRDLQGDTWLRGRATKVANLEAGWPVVRLDAGGSRQEVLAAVVATGTEPVRLLASCP